MTAHVGREYFDGDPLPSERICVSRRSGIVRLAEPARVCDERGEDVEMSRTKSEPSRASAPAVATDAAAGSRNDGYRARCESLQTASMSAGAILSSESK